MSKVFPTVIIGLAFIAGIVYLCYGDVRQAMYWISVSILNMVVTY